MLIEKYSAGWINDFAGLKNKIVKGLTRLDYLIEKDGSTSVPNFRRKANYRH